jgi:hypothetical protein
VAGVVAVLVAAGIASASIPDGAGVIHGCYATNGANATNGTPLNIIDSASASCNGKQTAITWGLSAFSGRINSIPEPVGTSSVFGAPTGISAADGSASFVQTLSPATGMTISNLEAFATNRLQPDVYIDVFVESGGVALLTCEIGEGQFGCSDSSDTGAVPPGSQLVIQVQVTNGMGLTAGSCDLEFGFAATTS